MLHRQRKDQLLQVVLDRVRQLAEQAKEHAHLLGVARVDELEGPQPLLVVRLGVAGGELVGLGGEQVHAAAARLAAALAHIRGASHVAAGKLDPVRVHPAGGSVAERPPLLPHRLEKEAEERAQVLRPQALVPVREDGEADEGVGVRELCRLRGHVLANKRHREQLPRLRRRARGGLLEQR